MRMKALKMSPSAFAGVLLLCQCLLVCSQVEVSDHTVDFSSLNFPGHVTSLVWLSEQIFILLTSFEEAYIGRDRGEQFFNLADGILLPKDAKFKEAVISKSKNGAVAHLTDGNGKLYVGTDNAWTWEEFSIPVGLEQFCGGPHAGLLLSSRVSNDCSGLNNSQMLRCRKLYWSGDYGKTWDLILEFVQDYTFVSRTAIGHLVYRPEPVEIMASALRLESRSSNQKFGSWDAEMDILTSRDKFRTTKVLYRGGNRFVMFGPSIVSAIVSSVNGSMVIDTCNNRRKWGTEMLPLPGLGEDSIPVYQRENAQCRRWTQTTPFESWPAMALHKSTHRIVVAHGEAQPDVTRVHTGFDSKAYFMNQPKHNDSCLQTYMLIRVPERLYSWRRVTLSRSRMVGSCKSENCTLNLHILNPELELQISERLPGIMIGIGNEGDCLSHDLNVLNTYISKDGGITWSYVAPGAYSISNRLYRGHLILAEMFKPSDHLLIALFQEEAWRKLMLPRGEIEHIRFIDCPHNYAYFHPDPKVIVTGNLLNKTRSIIFSVDLPIRFTRICTRATGIGNETGDFTLIDKPTGGIPSPSEVCFDGYRVLVPIIKNNVQCTTDAYLGITQISKPCECTLADVVCGIGYTRLTPSGSCKRIQGLSAIFLAISTTCPCWLYRTDTCADSEAYIRRRHNGCVGGVLNENSNTESPLALCTTVLSILGVFSFVLIRFVLSHALDRLKQKSKLAEIVRSIL